MRHGTMKHDHKKQQIDSKIPGILMESGDFNMTNAI